MGILAEEHHWYSRGQYNRKLSHLINNPLADIKDVRAAKRAIDIRVTGQSYPSMASIDPRRVESYLRVLDGKDNISKEGYEGI